SNAAGRDGSALRMLKLFRDRPLSVGDVRTGTIPSLLPSQKHYLKVYRPRRFVTKRRKIDSPLAFSGSEAIIRVEKG
ncbi:MAG: hypothetical protein V1736_08280, partial [Pseudomonadota bacterium]